MILLLPHEFEVRYIEVTQIKFSRLLLHYKLSFKPVKDDLFSKVQTGHIADIYFFKLV